MSIGSFLFGGSKPRIKFRKGSVEDTSAHAQGWQLGNRVGAKYTGMDANGMPQFDYSQTGKPVSMADATKGYDFSGMNAAQAKFAKGPKALTQTYTPSTYSAYKFNFSDPSLIDQATTNQYALGSGDIRREGAGNLEKLREGIGTRRPGLLLRAGNESNRSTSEELAKLRMGLDTEALNQKLTLEKAQQLAQAGEDSNAFNLNAGEQYKGYASRSDLEKTNQSNIADYLKSLSDVNYNKVGLQKGITDSEREYQDKGLDYIDQLHKFLQGTRRGAGNTQSSGLFGGIKKIGDAAASFYRK